MTNRTRTQTRLGRWTRAGMILAAVGMTAVLMIAGRLRPDARGYGTHQSLGLPPCSFRALTGSSCPTCGMTTAFAWFVRGRFGAAFASNPGGLFAASSCVGLIPWLLAGATRGRPIGTKTLENPVLTLIAVGMVVTLSAWTLRMFIE